MGERKKMLENEKVQTTHVYMNIIYCAVSCWLLGGYCDREKVNNEVINLMKAQYLQD
jgi:hypothetical protein